MESNQHENKLISIIHLKYGIEFHLINIYFKHLKDFLKNKTTKNKHKLLV